MTFSEGSIAISFASTIAGTSTVKETRSRGVGGRLAVAEDRPIQGEIHIITGGSSESMKLPETKRPRLKGEFEDAIIFTK